MKMRKNVLINQINGKEKDILIGRGEKSDLVITGNNKKTKNTWENDPQGVSRKHARIYFKEDEVYIEDLNSTNGTKIYYGSRYKKINKPTPLREGYEIFLGNYGPILFG
jgi:pSer/pThr/pTyr-binding forkhead associated (FHA) protein